MLMVAFLIVIVIMIKFDEVLGDKQVHKLKIVPGHDRVPNGDFPVLYCLCNRPSVSRIGSDHIV